MHTSAEMTIMGSKTVYSLPPLKARLMLGSELAFDSGLLIEKKTECKERSTIQQRLIFY